MKKQKCFLVNEAMRVEEPHVEVTFADMKLVALKAYDGLKDPKEMLKQALEETMRNNLPVLEKVFLMAEVNIFVLTNIERNLGAIALFYPEIQRQLGQTYGDYFVLPSSVHEVLIVPKNEKTAGKFTGKKLKDIVDTINHNPELIAPHEVLSSHVYEYSKESNTLTVAA